MHYIKFVYYGKSVKNSYWKSQFLLHVYFNAPEKNLAEWIGKMYGEVYTRGGTDRETPEIMTGLYRNNKSAIKMNNEVLREFNVSWRVKQGCAAHSVVLNKVLKKEKNSASEGLR